MQQPALSVVVPSHNRPLRLRWLLNALHAQTLDRSHWEVVVGHSSTDAETDELLSRHPLHADGTLRWTRPSSGRTSPGANRNVALELARGMTVVFTDDDCRPPDTWLANVLETVMRNPHAIVQGPIWGDPDEEAVRESSFYRTQDQMWVPRPWAECCNIAYPRRLLQRVGGFPEDVVTGEDTALHLRAIATGAPYLGEPAMLTYHAIEEAGLMAQIRGARRWQDLPLLYKRHPGLRRHLPLWVFWKRTHVWLPLALLGARLMRRQSGAWLLAVPWAIQRQARAGVDGRLRYLLEMPGWVAIDLSEVTALAIGSVRHGSLVL